MYKIILIMTMLITGAVFMFGSNSITFDEKTNKLLKIEPKSENAELYFFNDRLPNDFFERLKSQEKIQLFPPFADRGSWENAKNNRLNKAIVTEIIHQADECLNTTPIELTEEDFYRFVTDGNRTVFEKKYFERRKNLSYLVLALCLTANKEKYLPSIIVYTKAILDEKTWCLPAHSVWIDKKLSPLHQCDLFAGDTASMLALMSSIIGDELDRIETGFADKINQKVIAETFGNLLNTETSELNYWYRSEWPWNWIPWCTSNCIITALLAAPTPELRAEYIQMMLYPLARYYKSFDDSGFSSEGAMYFPMSAGMLFNALEALDKAVPNSTEKIYQEEKIYRMLTFIAGIRVGKNIITYSDSTPKAKPNQLLTALIAKRLNSAEMAAILQGKSLNADVLTASQSHRLLYDNLNIFFNYPTQLPESSTAIIKPTLFRNRLAILRTNGFFGSIKGGQNNEPHNHNDLGHVTIYYKDAPIIIDVGTGPYSANDFNENRYTLWYTRGNGHNAPIINGIEQENNEKHYAEIAEITETNGVFSSVCDLKNAYNEKAEIIDFKRELRCGDDFAEICDNLKTAKKTTVEISFFTIQKPIVKKDKIRLGEVDLTWNNINLVRADMEIEKFGGWDEPIYRIVFKGESNSYSFKFTEAK